MEHIKHYKTILNNLYLQEDFPKLSKSINAMISKSNLNLLRLNKLTFSGIPEKDPETRNDNQALPNRSNRKKTIYPSTLSSRKLVKKALVNQLNSSSSLIFYQPKTRNRSKWPFNTPTNKTNLISNTNITDTSSFLKTSLNNTSPICYNDTTMKSKKKLPNLSLLNQTKLKHSNGSNNLSKTIGNVTLPSPHLSSPYDTEITIPETLFQTSINANSCPKNKTRKEYSYCSFRNKCNKIEKDCLQVQKEVKNMPMKLILDKRKFQTLMNENSEENENDDDIVDELPNDEIKKIFTMNDLMNLKIKNKRILLESKCITKANPLLAYNAEKTIKCMFSIKTKPKEEYDYITANRRLTLQTEKINKLIRKSLLGNEKFHDSIAKLKLIKKKKK